MPIGDYSLYDPESSGPSRDSGRDLEDVVEELILSSSEEGRKILADKLNNRADCALVYAVVQFAPGVMVAFPFIGLLLVPTPEPMASGT